MGAVLSDITQGRRAGSVRAGGVVVHEVTYRAGAWMGAHSHTRANITLVVGGGFQEESEEGSCRARALAVVFKRSGFEHATGVGGSGLRTVVIELDKDEERRVQEVVRVRGGCVCIEGGAASRAAAQVWAASRLPPPARDRAVDAGLAALVEALRVTARAEGATDRPAAAMRSELERRFVERVGASALGARFGLHPTSVTRIFRRELGCGVMDALRAARVREAAERLAMSDAALSRVSCACGFADQSHMGRQFRRETGLTPGEYRALSRGLESF